MKFKNNNLIKNSTPIGDNSHAKKLLKWKMKKTIYTALKELNSLKKE